MLTLKQKEIVVEKTGKFVVRACPGSGKTYSVAARLAHQMSNWPHGMKGIAAISFTNVAWEEIERKVRGEFEFRRGISYPHFLGTIDSFVNQFIFLPFGHLVLGCENRPVLVGEPHGSWKGRNFYQQQFDNMTYDVGGNLVLLNNTNLF